MHIHIIHAILYEYLYYMHTRINLFFQKFSKAKIKQYKKIKNKRKEVKKLNVNQQIMDDGISGVDNSGM